MYRLPPPPIPVIPILRLAKWQCHKDRVMGREHVPPCMVASDKQTKSQHAQRQQEPPGAESLGCFLAVPLGIQSWVKDGSRLVLHLAVRMMMTCMCTVLARKGVRPANEWGAKRSEDPPGPSPGKTSDLIFGSASACRGMPRWVSYNTPPCIFTIPTYCTGGDGAPTYPIRLSLLEEDVFPPALPLALHLLQLAVDLHDV